MDKERFLDTYAAGLDQLVRISSEAGSRKDYVQGGGGNTSAKLDERWMAVKASGYRLGQVTADEAYAVLDYQALRAFFRDQANLPAADIEAEGARAVRESILTIDRMPARRPSVEAGFHALLGTCVLHTHSVYANLVCCSDSPRELAAQAMQPLGLAWGFVPYIDPGTRLSFAIAAEAARVESEMGAQPAVLFMQNHGIIVSAPDADACLAIHDRVNLRLAELFGVQPGDWPEPMISEEEDVIGSGYQSATPWLRKRLAGWSRPDPLLSILSSDALYPDQLVYLFGKVAFTGKPACRIDPATGDVAYSCGENEARTIEETLCAVLFIYETLERAGRRIQPMDASAKAFIAGWESESYRKTITAGGENAK